MHDSLFRAKLIKLLNRIFEKVAISALRLKLRAFPLSTYIQHHGWKRKRYYECNPLYPLVFTAIFAGMTLPAWMQGGGSSAPGGMSSSDSGAPAPAPAPAPVQYSTGSVPGMASNNGYTAPAYGGGVAIPPPSASFANVPTGLPNASASGLMHTPLPVAATKFGIDRERKFNARERRRVTLFDVPPGGVAAIVGHDPAAAAVASATDQAGAAGGANLQASRHARLHLKWTATQCDQTQCSGCALSHAPLSWFVMGSREGAVAREAGCCRRPPSAHAAN